MQTQCTTITPAPEQWMKLQDEQMRINQEQAIKMTQTQQQITAFAHQEAMADKFKTPTTVLFTVAIVAVTAYRLVAKAIHSREMIAFKQAETATELAKHGQPPELKEAIEAINAAVDRIENVLPEEES